MSTNAFIGKGCTISVGNEDSPLTYTAIGEITDFEGLDGQASVIDATHIGSTHKEKLVGIPDEGKFTCTMNLYPDDAGQLLLRTYRTSRALVDWKIALADGGTTQIIFTGYVLGFSIQGSTDDKVTASLTVEISGAATWS